jgi:hypothetical protein
MAAIDALARDFLAQQRFAVVGVSRTREDAANAIYRKLRDTNRPVYPVNPNIETFDDAPCYPDLAALPEPVDGVVVVTKPERAEEIVRQCIALKIPRVWMHCSLGVRPPGFARNLAAGITSVSEQAAQLGRDHGLTVIAGGCPMMFCDPVDFGHKCMRGTLRLFGSLAA